MGGSAQTFMSRMSAQGVPCAGILVTVAIYAVMMAFDYPNGTLTVAALPVVALLLVCGWYMLRRPKAVMMTPTMPSVTLTQKFIE